MSEPVGVAMCEEPATRSDFVTAIGNRWHRIYRDTLAIADLLFIAKKKLDVAEFKTMVLEELPFSMDTAYRIMRIAGDPKLAAVAHAQVLPRDLTTLQILTRLPDNDFFDGVRYGHINDSMTREQAQDYLNSAKRHRPFRIQKIVAPYARRDGRWASYSERVGLYIQRRLALGISQNDLDKKLGWTDGMTSKLEIPHMNDGRVAGTETEADWIKALGGEGEMVWE